MKLPIQDITMIMLKSFRELYEEGEINLPADTDVDPRSYYGFSPEDVVEIHTHKKGMGDGVWFRLNDGRVFDKFGSPVESDRALFDTVKN